MVQTNNEVQTHSVISLLQLVLSEQETLCNVEDKLDDDVPEGSRKRERLEKQAEDTGSTILSIQARPAKIKELEGGDDKTGQWGACKT